MQGEGKAALDTLPQRPIMPDSPSERRNTMTSLVLMTIIGFILFMSRGIVGPVSSLYAQELGASYVMLSALGTTTSVLSVIASYMWGRTSDMVGRRKAFMLSGLGLLALEALLTAMIPLYGHALPGVKPYLWLFPLHLLGAMGGAAFTTSNLAMLGDLLEGRDAQRGQRMGWVRGISSLGFGLMAFGSGKIADTFQINIPFYISSALLAVALVLALNIKEQGFAPTAAPPPFDWRTAWRSFLARFQDAWGVIVGSKDLEGDDTAVGVKLPLAPVLISSFLFSLMMGSVYSVWANYMKNEALFSTTIVTILWATASTSEFPFMILAGWLSDRVGRLPLMGVGFLLWAVVISSYIFAPIMPWIVVVQLTRGFAFSAVTASAMAYAAEARGRSQRGQVAGLYGAAGGIGSILGRGDRRHPGAMGRFSLYVWRGGQRHGCGRRLYFLIVWRRQRRRSTGKDIGL